MNDTDSESSADGRVSPHEDPATDQQNRSQPETAVSSVISKSEIRMVRSLSIIMVDPVAGSRHASSQIPQRRSGYDSYVSTVPE